MATMAHDVQPDAAIRPVLTQVPSPATVCGECRHHMPRATSDGSWCALASASFFRRPVIPRQTACNDFAAWPEGSSAPAFLSAMRF